MPSCAITAMRATTARVLTTMGALTCKLIHRSSVRFFPWREEASPPAGDRFLAPVIARVYLAEQTASATVA
jgi:hypothetical protein